MNDTERLDWLQSEMAEGNVELFNCNGEVHIEIRNGRKTYGGETVRDAIDSAADGEKPYKRGP